MIIRQGKILVVDNNEDIQSALKRLSRPMAKSFTTCNSLAEINLLRYWIKAFPANHAHTQSFRSW